MNIGRALKSGPGRAAIEFSWMVGGRALALVASLLYLRLTAEYLSKADFGLLSVAVGLANGLFVLTCSPLFLPVTRIVNENKDDPRGLRRTISPYLARVAAGTVVLALAFLAVRPWTGDPFGLDTTMVLLIPVFVWLYGVYGVVNAMFVAWRARRMTALSQCGLAWIRLLLTLPLFWLSSATANWVFAAYCVSLAPLLAIQFWIAGRYHPQVYDNTAELDDDLKAKFWSLVKVGGPQVWINASIFFIDKPLFALVLPLEQVAVYAVIQQIARALSSLFIEMGVQFLMPYAFRGGQKSAARQLSMSLGLLASTIAIAAVMYAIGPHVVALAASEKYAGIDRDILAWATFGVCLSFAINALELKGFAEFSVGRYIVGHVLQAIIFLGGGLWAAQHHDLTGVIACLVAAVLVRLAVVAVINMTGGGGEDLPAARPGTANREPA